MTKKKAEPLYKALVTLWTTDDEGQERYMEPGEIAKLAHLPEEAIKRLVDKGAIEEYTGVWPIPEPEPAAPIEVTEV